MEQGKEPANRISKQTWLRYAATRDSGLRNEILMEYLYIVNCSLKKSQTLIRNREDAEDMASQGVIELIACIDRYDVERGVQFDSFASIRVRGAMVDYIRKKDWVSRDIRKRLKRIQQAEEQLRGELQRDPDDEELAERMGITAEELAKARSDEVNYAIVSFEETISDTGMTLMDVIEDAQAHSPERRMLERDFTRHLARCIDELEEKERTVISLYYYEELKLKEIAFVLNLTVSRVSQIHSKALTKLKARIEQYMKD
ncbi:sigma-70 family RNA polymerase sigma factor [Bacillota bacterium Meth-B3]|nr:FliA/WhiG family RNA polymerase sigma factor [Christensenellaceae bacterium]MEA5064532.1 FliA/WhiG family RNA polymerase sigma factor [Eubacteriales bacterium]